MCVGRTKAACGASPQPSGKAERKLAHAWRRKCVIRKTGQGVRARHKTDTRRNRAASKNRKRRGPRQREDTERHNKQGDPDRLGERPQATGCGERKSKAAECVIRKNRTGGEVLILVLVQQEVRYSTIPVHVELWPLGSDCDLTVLLS